MKKAVIILSAIAAALLLSSCSHNLTVETEMKVLLDSLNTYKAGTPVVFNVSGNEDYAVFFSGEEGHVYRHRNRTEIDKNDVIKATLTNNMEFRWGLPSLEMYISHDFNGFKGDDFYADKEMLRKMYADGMPGWKKIELNGNDVSRHDEYYATDIDVSDYVDGLSVLYHYKSFTDNFKQPQATYRIDGGLVMEYEGMAPVQRSLVSLGFSFIWTNDEFDETKGYEQHPYGGTVNPYLYINPKGPGIYNIIGCTGDAYSYDHELWIVNNATPLNTVEPDTGETIKNFQNKLSAFRHVYETPGTYTATFVGFNETLEGRSEVVKNVRVIITE